MSDVRALIESVCKPNPDINDARELFLAFANQLELHNAATGTDWLNPTTGTLKAQSLPPAQASAVVAGANGNINLQLTNPSQAAQATIYHEVSYSTVKNFSQNVTTLPVSAATSYNIPAPGQQVFVRYRSSFDGSTWNTHRLAQNSVVDAGLQSSAASEPATVLNQYNYATVKASGGSGGIPAQIQVYGGVPYSMYVAGRGSTQGRRPSATLLNTNGQANLLVAYDGSEFHAVNSLPQTMPDSWEPVGQALTNGTPGGGGSTGGNGARLTAI